MKKKYKLPRKRKKAFIKKNSQIFYRWLIKVHTPTGGKYQPFNK